MPRATSASPISMPTAYSPAIALRITRRSTGSSGQSGATPPAEAAIGSAPLNGRPFRLIRFSSANARSAALTRYNRSSSCISR
ncbi:hypothetical protein M3194_09460 [Paenibacillus glycanilyticus]|uniref:hypothetical protein n=1 Tax=Paenibacillus glycanilyticus TaxID=126569 RepID=UPI00203FB8AA|nr:hypothetical protein [Paenibacillus glycanilyticus]MCM3627593.1 hypothetical protein [Paenibacillus glycanilyticus]